MESGLIAIIIILVVIVGAIWTRRCTEFLILGSILGAIALYQGDFLLKWIDIVKNVVGKEDNVWLWLVCGLFGSLIAVLQASKGTYGFQKLIAKICTNQRRTMLSSFILGIIIFVDDYLNVLTVGVCMKGISDKRRIPREALAFTLDSTGAPVSVLIPFSTWAVFYATLFFNENLVNTQYTDALGAYISAIPYSFYPMIALFFVFLFSMGWFPKLGLMKKAYQRVEETGMVYSERSKKYNKVLEDDEKVSGNVWNFVIPIVMLATISIITSDLLLGVIIAIFVCFLMYIPFKLMSMEDFFNSLISGYATMLPIFFMLVGAFSLAFTCTELGLTDYLIDIAKPILSAQLFPTVSFILLALLAFVTGSNWGMSAVVIPILIPMCQALEANVVLTMAAIISGGAFGSHACFYTDATALSSNAAGIDNLEHALSQMPYVMIAAGISTVLFLVFGFVM